MVHTVPALAMLLLCAAVIVLPTEQYTVPAADRFTNWVAQPYPAGVVTKGWAFTNFDTVVKIGAAYLSLVCVGLLMKKKGEEEGKVNPSIDSVVKNFMTIYNLAQCILCAYMIYITVVEFYKEGYSFSCNTYDVKRTGMARATWLFYLSKIFDFCDTFFIVARKKWRQLSFLHVYHHLSIFLVYWMDTLSGYDGEIYLTIVLNGFVHLVMYSYYFLATFGYNAWWKNYITLLQLFQFVLMNIQAIWDLSHDCPYPRNITWFYLFYIISLFALFMNFYIRTYGKKPAAGSKGAATSKTVKPKKAE
eukprot:TRINITY_DN15315_c0_g1_i1.p1 TRINITY_DN15315_c0_g1~~TRINITY_DN15315_c0_g1_i1.p1  ORF type:complete len:304 (-),score=71.67 TRINITY_DN15315_c0_g1_i1:122-1033(-)